MLCKLYSCLTLGKALEIVLICTFGQSSRNWTHMYIWANLCKLYSCVALCNTSEIVPLYTLRQSFRNCTLVYPWALEIGYMWNFNHKHWCLHFFQKSRKMVIIQCNCCLLHYRILDNFYSMSCAWVEHFGWNLKKI